MSGLRQQGELVLSRSGGQILWAMDANVLFSKALGLGSGWKVVKSEMDVAGRELKLWLDFEPGSQFACPQCGEFCPVHDTVEKKWRHLDFWHLSLLRYVLIPVTQVDRDLRSGVRPTFPKTLRGAPR